jgi:hypothetical protein
VAILPLVKNKPELIEKAREVRHWTVMVHKPLATHSSGQI